MGLADDASGFFSDQNPLLALEQFPKIIQLYVLEHIPIKSDWNAIPKTHYKSTRSLQWYIIPFFPYFPFWNACGWGKPHTSLRYVREHPHSQTIRWARISFLGCITSSLYIFFCPKGQCSKWLSKNGLISLRVLLFLIQKREKMKRNHAIYLHNFFYFTKNCSVLNNSWPFLFTKRKKNYYDLLTFLIISS